MNDMLEVGNSIITRWTKRRRTKKTLSATYNKDYLTINDFKSEFGENFKINDEGFNSFSIKSKSDDSCLLLREMEGTLYIRNLHKCVIGGKELLLKLIRLTNTLNKALIINEDTSSIHFNFGTKQFGKETYTLRFGFALSIMYIKSYGYTWYNSLGFLNDEFQKNRAYFTKKFQNEFEINQKKIKEIKTITKKEENMTKEEYDKLREYEKDFNIYSKFFKDDELDSHFSTMTHKLRYQKFVLGGSRKKRNIRKTIHNRKILDKKCKYY